MLSHHHTVLACSEPVIIASPSGCEVPRQTNGWVIQYTNFITTLLPS